MKERFVYFYFMKNEPEKIDSAIQAHVEYWRNKNLPNYFGGPFADRTGGLIIFDSASIENAKKITEKDPFVERDIIDKKWVKEWIPE